MLVPQVMLYGFAGVRPRPGGFSIAPNLPSDWPELSITRIHVQDHVVDLTVRREEIVVQTRTPGRRPLEIEAPPGLRRTVR